MLCANVPSVNRLAHDLTFRPVRPTASWLFSLPATARRAVCQPVNKLTEQPPDGPDIKPSSWPLSKPRSHSFNRAAPAPHPSSKTLIHLGCGLAMLILSALQSVVTTGLWCVLILHVPPSCHYPHTDTVLRWMARILQHLLQKSLIQRQQIVR